MALIAAHIFLAVLLFKLVNWVGEHATDFGYGSTTLFEEPNESLALNFFIRALAPAVFMVALSATAVAVGYAELRIGIYWIAVYYYLLRAGYIIIMNMHQLVSWSRFLLHSAFGLGAAALAYRSLILPNRSLLPDLDAAGNELWLAIFAFLYTAANKVKVSGGPGDRRRNAFVKRKYENAKRLYGELIDRSAPDDNLQLTAYAVLIYEDYCRPPSMRIIERLCFWKDRRTTGIMQVNSRKALTDEESVVLGLEKLAGAWQVHADEGLHGQTWMTISDYNKDRDYVTKVFEIMEIIAHRAEPRFLPAYRAISG